jgi:cell division protein FtsB
MLPRSLDDQIKDIVRMERQIAQKQRELETLQRRIDSLPVEADDSSGSDTQHALRTTPS